VKRAANKYQLPALLLNKSINLKYKGTTEMATINGTDFNDNGIDKKKLFGTDKGDSIYGKRGNDILSGLDGNDNLYGGHHEDLLYGGYGKDLLSGQLGYDTLYGEQGNDILHGGYHNDILDGGSGNDVLVGWGGMGNEYDTLTGGADADRFVLGNQLLGVFYKLDDKSNTDYYATITDFKKKDGDKVEVMGNQSNYALEKGLNKLGGSAKDTRIYFTHSSGARNLIAVVQDTTNISFSDFTFKSWG
jgi:Ca2+-binding RTX toxin-like protein